MGGFSALPAHHHSSYRPLAHSLISDVVAGFCGQKQSVRRPGGYKVGGVGEARNPPSEKCRCWVVWPPCHPKTPKHSVKLDWYFWHCSVVQALGLCICLECFYANDLFGEDVESGLWEKATRVIENIRKLCSSRESCRNDKLDEHCMTPKCLN